MEVTLAPRFWDGVPEDAQALVDTWLAAQGERVAVGQVLARVILAKSTLELAAPAAGVLTRILVPAGANFARGEALATMRAD